MRAGGDAAPARMPRTHPSGRPRVAVRPHYEGLPSMAGRDADEGRRKPSGSSWRKCRSSPRREARPRGQKSPPMERREAPARCKARGTERFPDAPYGAPSPRIFAGVDSPDPPVRGKRKDRRPRRLDKEHGRRSVGCLTFESGKRARAAISLPLSRGEREKAVPHPQRHARAPVLGLDPRMTRASMVNGYDRKSYVGLDLRRGLIAGRVIKREDGASRLAFCPAMTAGSRRGPNRGALTSP
jgi:hypothetical protein